MFTWIKANVLPVLFCTITSLVAALAIMFTLWQGAQHEAQVYHNLANMQGRVIEAQSRITQNETRVNHVTERVVQRIMESPNASTPIPNDIATAWADGIDSVWNDRTSSANGSAADVHGPTPSEAGSRRPDNGSTSSILGPAGSSIPKVQFPDGTKRKDKWA